MSGRRRWAALRGALALAVLVAGAPLHAAAPAASDPAKDEKIRQITQAIADLDAQEASLPPDMRPNVERLKRQFEKALALAQGRPLPVDPAQDEANWVRPGPREGAPPDPNLFLAHPDWAKSLERIAGGPEAELLVRVGSISNFIYGFPPDIDPFSGASTPPHMFPWDPPKGTPSGLKRITIGSGVRLADLSRPGGDGDGYSEQLRYRDTRPQPLVIPLGPVPATIDRVLLQLFIDDFQAPHIHSYFQASVNGVRMPNLEKALNTVDQTGPTGKLITVPLLPEYFAMLRTGTLTVLIDDPLTHQPDGFAVDFARILVNPRKLTYTSGLQGSVRDAATGQPVAGASVSAAMAATLSGPGGAFALDGVPSGLIVAMASKEGYAPDAQAVDVLATETGQVQFTLHRSQENSASLEQQIAQGGVATLYGIHFDLDKDTLRPDSGPTLEAVLAVMRKDPAARWVVSGHTDSTGAAEHNAALSMARAQAVCRWLQKNGIDARVLRADGQGSRHPVADNATPGGRALNRRVELQKIP